MSFPSFLIEIYLKVFTALSNFLVLNFKCAVDVKVSSSVFNLMDAKASRGLIL